MYLSRRQCLSFLFSFKFIKKGAIPAPLQFYIFRNQNLNVAETLIEPFFALLSLSPPTTKFARPRS